MVVQPLSEEPEGEGPSTTGTLLLSPLSAVSVAASVSLSLCLSVSLWSVCLPLAGGLCVCLRVCVSACLRVCVSACLRVCACASVSWVSS
jgi:hypothetical protein